MGKVKVNLGKWNTKEYLLPDYDSTMQCLKGESLMLYGWDELREKKYRPFFGIGIVRKIVKGEKGDMVYINFGMSIRHFHRKVYVYENHARRQILTLKKGQVCMIYGVCLYQTRKRTINGERKKVLDVVLFATGMQGWYVPTMVDIRKMPTNDEILNPNEEEFEEEEIAKDILDQFMEGEI